MILGTERLLLREFAPEDADALAAILGDPITMQYYPAPLTRAEVDHWICRNRARYENDGFGLWAILLKRTGKLIGDCGCVLQEVDGREEIEIGYHLRRDLWGNGYATEAAHACMEYATTTLGTDRVISLIRPENVQSRRVAEKNGLSCERVLFWHGYDHCVFARMRDVNGR